MGHLVGPGGSRLEGLILRIKAESNMQKTTMYPSVGCSCQRAINFKEASKRIATDFLFEVISKEELRKEVPTGLCIEARMILCISVMKGDLKLRMMCIIKC